MQDGKMMQKVLLELSALHLAFIKQLPAYIEFKNCLKSVCLDWFYLEESYL